MRTELHTALTDRICVFLDHFSRATGTRIVFYDFEGRLLKAGLDQTDCTYCKLIQDSLYGIESCNQKNDIGRSVARGEGMHSYQCHAGLMEVVVPLYTSGYLLGYAMIGQIRTGKTPPPEVVKDWERLHGDARLRKAFLALPHVTEDRLNALRSFFAMLVEYVIANHMVSLKGNSCLLAALEFMNEHVCEPLTLPQVARHIRRSPYSVSHAFRNHLQTTFTHVLTEMKLARAEEMFTSDPSVTVSDASERVGFSDPYYFSRLYRKHRGEPPSHLLKRIRNMALE